MNILFSRLSFKFLLLVITILSLFLASCSSYKNLTVKNKSLDSYEFYGDTIDNWSLVRQDSLWGYISEDGKLAVKRIFTWADDFSDGMALVQDQKDYSYINNEGKLLRKIKGSYAYPFSEGLAAVQKQDKWGYINRKGKWLIKPKFDWALPFSENRAAVTIGLQQGYINSEGVVVIPPVYDEAKQFTDGLAIVRENGRYGLIDTLGNGLISTHLKSIEFWEKDFYKLETGNKKLGLANRKGDLVLDTIYNEIYIVKEKYIRAKDDSKVGHFDLRGNVIIPMIYDFLGFISEEGFMAAEKNGKYGFINTQGEIVLPFEYESCEMGFKDDRTWIKKDGKFFLMDHHFNIIKEVPYDDAYYFNNGFALISKKSEQSYKGSSFGFVNKAGEEVISPQYYSAFHFNKHGITIVGKRKDGLTSLYLTNSEGAIISDKSYYSRLAYFGQGVIYSDASGFRFISPKTGQEISDFPYTDLYPLKYSDRKDLARVSKESKKGLIDTSLTELLPTEFDDIGEYINNRIAIRRESLWGFADEYFRIRIPLLYDDYRSFQNGIAIVKKNDLKGAIHPNGRVLVPLQYSDLSIDYIRNRISAEKEDGYDIYDMEGRLLLETDYSYFSGYWSENHATFRKDGKVGAMDFNFLILCEPIYDRIGPFRDGMAWVVNDGKAGFVNNQFQIVVPVELEDVEEFAFGFAKVKKDGKEYYINTKGEEVFPDEEKIKERETEIQRRKDGFFNFSS